MPVAADAAFFDQILDHLCQRGFDFTAYKRSSLMRRVTKRMQQVGVTALEQYLDYLQVHHEEFTALFNTILINVTSFFRDPDVWAYACSELLPVMIENRGNGDPLRVWCAGCASGQEAYTCAMVLAELVGIEALGDRVKIYATDVDDEALAEARQAIYSERHLADVPQPMTDKYFERLANQIFVNRDLRRTVVFGRHDLIQDAPISRVDLLLCRNTLMYLNADAQTRILGRFCDSLSPGGFLMLGRAETLFSRTAMFAPVDLKRRIFRTLPKGNHRDRLSTIVQPGRNAMANHGPNDFRAREAATDCRALQDDLQRSKQELELAHEELQTTNEELLSAVEKLETANEELRSTNEELRTINDELRIRSSYLDLADRAAST